MSVDEALRAWNCEGVSVSTVGLEGAGREMSFEQGLT